jgi:hypothetical protein
MGPPGGKAKENTEKNITMYQGKPEYPRATMGYPIVP